MMVARMGRVERRRAMEQYLQGLLLDGERKSVEPMAGRLVDKPHEREAMRQRLQQCVAVAAWSDAEMRRRLAQLLSLVAGARARRRAVHLLAYNLLSVYRLSGK
ncbi:transposase [Hyalangium sp. s54d21]|uniref:Transposase n=1 Tax=Hyalangium rubrum TaxID=3103134 RepID=A0ABU5HI57_9BACT|nr:transposase [Hyalangium sp. s54d21]MDY7233036.1 transposase [Hyalangium sp. s54d21]